MAKQKGSLLGEFKKIITDNHKNGRKLREGIPSVFKAADGKEYRLNNVSRFIRTGENPTFLDVELNKEVTGRRANAIKLQTSTSDQVTPWDPKKDVPEGLEGHHIRAVKQYEPFYKGLNEKEAAELTQWFVDEGVPLGNVKENIANLSPQVHKGKDNSIHTWARENNVQVFQDETGKGNFSIGKGKHEGKMIVRGGPDTNVKAVMPDMSRLSLNERYAALSNYLRWVQDPMDTELENLQVDEQSRTKMLKDNPGLVPEDLESSKVSPTLGNRMKLQNLDLKKLGKVGGKLNTADSVAQIIGGNPLGGGLGLLMQQPGFHKQIGKALGKTLAKSGAKLLPGVGMTMGTLEAAGYASQGRLTQAGIASFSALVGEVPGIGDFLSAGADLVNTGIDIATGNLGKVEMEIDDVKEFDGVPIRAARRLAKAA